MNDMTVGGGGESRKRKSKEHLRYMGLAKAFLKKFPLGTPVTNEACCEWLQTIYAAGQFTALLDVCFPQGIPKWTTNTVLWAGRRHFLQRFYRKLWMVSPRLNFTTKPVKGDIQGIRIVRSNIEFLFAQVPSLPEQQCAARMAKSKYVSRIASALVSNPDITVADRRFVEDQIEYMTFLSEQTALTEKTMRRLVDKRNQSYLMSLPTQRRIGFDPPHTPEE